MPLPLIVEPPSDERGFDSWAYAHAVDHLEIITAITRTQNITLPQYQLWPFNPSDVSGWLEQHARAHNDMNQQMGTPGNDLENVDFQDDQQAKTWFYLQYEEHLNVRQKLSI